MSGQVLECDAEECRVRFPDAPVEGRYWAIRSAATAAGWRIQSSWYSPDADPNVKDFCPDHAHLAPCPRRPQKEGWSFVGATCICGEHGKICKGCGEEYFTWENNHYVSSVGHMSEPGDSIEPYYRCVS